MVIVEGVPKIPRVPIIIHGEKGAAKSTAFRVIKKLIDPSEQELYLLPRSQNDLALILSQNHCCFFDNLDYVNRDQSSMLCVASTGGTVPVRKLYETDKHPRLILVLD
jgi:hypothetical protein